MKKTFILLLAAASALLPARTSASPYEEGAQDAPPEDTKEAQDEDEPLSEEELSALSDGSSSYVSTLLPLSPNAAALARYGEYPVSYTTGVPEISIPIYEIQLPGFSMPISISYHASGVRADDIASCVGLGWALNAGGAISRQVEGRPDFEDRNSAAVQQSDILYMDASLLKSQIAAVRSGSLSDIPNLQKLLTEGMAATYDLCSDRYSFNFGGKSGIMRYSFADGKFYALNHYPIDIERAVGTEDPVFTIDDGDGTTYVFAETERTGVASDENTTPISTWYLTRIVTLKGDAIEFEYGQEQSFDTYSISQCVKVGTWNEPDYYEDYSTYNNFIKQMVDISPDPQRFTHNPLYLKRIAWNGNEAVFDYANDRADICPTRLTKISILNSEGDTVKSATLGHEYFGPQAHPGQLRMMLKRLAVSGEGTYAFSYDTSQSLPAYAQTSGSGTNMVDYWGYYNGRDNRLIPSEVMAEALSGIGITSADAVYSSNRSPNFDYAKSGILTQISYPAGGSTSFTYEANSSGAGGIRVKAITDNPGAGYGSPSVTRSFTYSGAKYVTNLSGRFFYKGKHGCLGVEFNTHDYDEYTCYGSPMIPLSLESGASVFYTGVRETFGDGSYVDYAYSMGVCEDLSGHDTWVHPAVSRYNTRDEGSAPPLLIEKSVHGSDGSLKLKETNSYDMSSVRTFQAGARLAATYYSDGSAVPAPQDIRSKDCLFCESLTAVCAAATLASTVTVDYTTGITTTTSYTYGDLGKTLQPRTVTVSNGDGRDVRTEFTYAYESSDATAQLMAGSYKTTDLVTDVLVKRNGAAASLESRKYQHTQAGFSLSKITRGIGTNSPYEAVSVTSFDSFGNPLRVVENGCDATDLTWSADGAYPLSATSGGLTTSYQWKPLFGVKRITAPSGCWTGYEYTYGGRLSKVSDARGTIARYEYTADRVDAYSHISASTSTLYTDYYDGLGRKTASEAQGPTAGTTLYSVSSYDSRGRIAKEWLPVPKTSSGTTASADAYGDNSAFSETEYDELGRVKFVSTPGDDWAGKGRRVAYGSNAANSVKRYSAPTGEISMTKDGYWPAHTLTSELATDEDGLTVETFKDKEGRTVLERRAGSSDTYYVYNDWGQLRYVLSPQYQEAGYKAVYGYEYRYDERGRIVKKIAPQCEPEQFWYSDGSQRAAYFQDGALAAAGKCRYYLYDSAGRLTEQGLCTSRSGSYPGKKVEVKNYYDNYSFVTQLGASSLSASATGRRTGLLTGSSMALSDGTTLIEAYYYDAYERLIETRRLYPNGTVTSDTKAYAYSGSVASSAESNETAGIALSVANAYDPSTGALKTSTATFKRNGVAVNSSRIHSLSYDSFGRISGDARSSASNAMSYAYDLHGRVTSLSGPGYSSQLCYAGGLGTPRYNGFVSSMLWTGNGDTQQRGYKYEYDDLGRMTKAVYGEGASLSDHANRYNEEVLLYSANSMPRRLQRRGLKQDGKYGKIDNLHIYLDGNRVKSVLEDAADVLRTGSMDFVDGASSSAEYAYDECGRLVRDDNKGIELIRYDDCGFPREVCFAGGNRIRYVYAPDGRHLRTTRLTAVTP